jgi:ribosomal protein L16/L10AE
MTRYAFELFTKLLRRALRFDNTGDKRANLNNLSHFYPMIFDRAVSSKSAGSRMGKGKGAVKEWVIKISRGQILFSLPRGVNEESVKKIITQLNYRSTLKFNFIICR